MLLKLRLSLTTPRYLFEEIPASKMKFACLLISLLLCCCFLASQCWACSCPINPSFLDRRGTICRALNDTHWSPVIYKATVTSSYCKCLASSFPSIFSCINFYSTNGSVGGSVQRAYQCQDNPQFSSYYIERCPVVIGKSGAGKCSYKSFSRCSDCVCLLYTISVYRNP